ncbi:hypothetical protein MBLNU230_g1303t1 [Neophaeotheca triangularis]
MTAPDRLIETEPLTHDCFAPFGEVIENPQRSGNNAIPHVSANQGSATKYLDVTQMSNHYNLAPSRRPASVSMNMFSCKPRELSRQNGKQLFPVKILERHPFTPQTFAPLGLEAQGSTKYLVLVAPTLSSASRSKDGGQAPYPLPELRRKRSLKERLLGARPNPFTNDHSSVTTPPHASANTPLGVQVKGPGLPDLQRLRAFIVRGDQAVTYGPGTWHAPMVVLGEKPVDFVVTQFVNGVSLEDTQEVELEPSGSGEGTAVVVEDELLKERAKL